MRKTAALLLCAAIVGCATFSAKRYQTAAADIAGMIDSGDAAGLAAISQTPFLLDGELIMLDPDVAAFWTSIIEAGFRVGTPSAVVAEPLDGASFSVFADTMEVRAFFQKYVSDKGSVVVLRGGSFQLLLLLDRDGAKTTILGFKGPEAL